MPTFVTYILRNLYLNYSSTKPYTKVVPKAEKIRKDFEISILNFFTLLTVLTKATSNIAKLIKSYFRPHGD